jgi:hypothetical protein
MWNEYRRIKLRLLVLLIGWVPFGVLCGAGLPFIFGTYVPSYALAAAYMLFTAYSFLKYELYPCPNCGSSLRGRQLFQKVCSNCCVEINSSALEEIKER